MYFNHKDITDDQLREILKKGLKKANDKNEVLTNVQLETYSNTMMEVFSYCNTGEIKKMSDDLYKATCAVKDNLMPFIYKYKQYVDFDKKNDKMGELVDSKGNDLKKQFNEDLENMVSSLLKDCHAISNDLFNGMLTKNVATDKQSETFKRDGMIYHISHKIKGTTMMHDALDGYLDVALDDMGKENSLILRTLIGRTIEGRMDTSLPHHKFDVNEEERVFLIYLFNVICPDKSSLQKAIGNQNGFIVFNKKLDYYQD